MRLTEDKYDLLPTDQAFEIMYRYHNEEASTPEPDRKQVKDIPPEIKIWKEEKNCWIAIIKMLKNQRS